MADTPWIPRLDDDVEWNPQGDEWKSGVVWTVHRSESGAVQVQIKLVDNGQFLTADLRDLRPVPAPPVAVDSPELAGSGPQTLPPGTRVQLAKSDAVDLDTGTVLEVPGILPSAVVVDWDHHPTLHICKINTLHVVGGSGSDAQGGDR